MSLPTIPRLAASVLPLALLCACAATRPLDPGWLATLSAQPPTALLLLGEQHDAPEHQQWEQATVKWLAQRGQLAAVVIEMAEAGASTEGLPPTASEAEVRGALRWPDEAWPWADYGPVVMAAVRAGAPVLGGNLPRARLASARNNGALEARLPPEALARQQADVREGHCGLLPEGQVPAMARIQLARDQSLAETAVQALRPGRTVVLAAGHQQALQLGLGLLRGGELLQVLRQAVFLGHEHRFAQHVQALVQVGAGQRVDDGVCGLLRGLIGLGAQGAGTVAPALQGGLGLQGLGRLGKGRQVGVRLLERWHRRIHHTCRVGQVELHALGQCRCQRLVRLQAAVAGHHGFVVGTQAGALGHGLQERRPDFAHGLGIVLQQLKVRGQTLLLQQRQRGRTQQRGKPAVKGADLHRATGLQQLAV